MLATMHAIGSAKSCVLVIPAHRAQDGVEAPLDIFKLELVSLLDPDDVRVKRCKIGTECVAPVHPIIRGIHFLRYTIADVVGHDAYAGHDRRGWRRRRGRVVLDHPAWQDHGTAKHGNNDNGRHYGKLEPP